MKRRMFKDSLYFLAAIVLIFVFVVYPISVFSPEYYGRSLLPSFYTMIFGVMHMYVWMYFVFPQFIIRRCRSCGSRNLTYKISESVFPCIDCGYTLTIDNLPGYEKWRLYALMLTGLFAPLGVYIVVGCTIAGVMNYAFLFFAVLCAIYVPSVAALFLGLYKLFGRFASSFVQKHKGTAALVFFIIFCVLACLLLEGYWIPLAKIFESIYGELKPTSQFMLAISELLKTETITLLSLTF